MKTEICKMILLGDTGAGKTSLLSMSHDNTFNDTYNVLMY